MFEESPTTRFEGEALTATCPSQQAFHLFGSAYHRIDFGDLSLGEYVPPARGRHAGPKTMEQLLDLGDAEAGLLGPPYDGQVPQDP
jgi:hypothetical protein